jgi:hypothetical protein
MEAKAEESSPQSRRRRHSRKGGSPCGIHACPAHVPTAPDASRAGGGSLRIWQRFAGAVQRIIIAEVLLGPLPGVQGVGHLGGNEIPTLIQ